MSVQRYFQRQLTYMLMSCTNQLCTCFHIRVKHAHKCKLSRAHAHAYTCEHTHVHACICVGQIFDDNGYQLWVMVYVMITVGLASDVYISRKVSTHVQIAQIESKDNNKSYELRACRFACVDREQAASKRVFAVFRAGCRPTAPKW
jgi:hypothetical protein